MNKAFECSMCGQCCHGEGGIVVSSAEQDRLSQYLDLSLEEFQARYTDKKEEKRVLKTDPQGCCIFFEQNKGCTVHPCKPDICRAWPFFRGNLIDESSWQMAQEYCPGLSRDVSHKQFVQQGLQYLRENGLIHTKSEKDAAEALIIDFADQA